MFLRFLLPGWVGVVPALVFPLFVRGKRLLPSALAYGLAVLAALTLRLAG